MPAGPITVPKSMEYLGHFQHLLCCTPASGAEQPPLSCVPQRELAAGAQLPSGLFEQRGPALLQQLPAPREAEHERAGGCSPCTVVSSWLGDPTCVRKLAGQYWKKIISIPLTLFSFYVCLIQYSFARSPLLKKKKKCRWEAACWNKHKSSLFSTYLKALSHVLGKSIRQHYSNKVWNIAFLHNKHFCIVFNISFRFMCSLFTLCMLCISQTAVHRLKKCSEAHVLGFFPFSSPSKEVIDKTRYLYPMHIQTHLQL